MTNISYNNLVKLLKESILQEVNLKEDLEDNLIFGDLDISNSSTNIFPENFVNKADVYIHIRLKNTSISHKQSNTYVIHAEGNFYWTPSWNGGHLINRHYKIVSSKGFENSNDISCYYFIANCGNINISNTQITAIPKDLTCNELDISNTPIKELNIIYLNSLVASNSLLEKFKIYPLDKYISNITDIIDYLKLDHTQLKELPSNLSCNYLDISYTQIKELPEDLEVYRTLDLTGTNILELPQSLKTCKCIKGFIGNKTKYPDFHFEENNSFDEDDI